VIPNIKRKISELKHELHALKVYSNEDLANIIKEVGFKCDLCGRCCTNEFNDHVFLLDRDTTIIKEIEPTALVPAPYYELCDQYGRFYVCGYSLRTQHDGSCIFLERGSCRIYNHRLTICRIYPYMLHREPDEKGIIDWRQISGLNQHGIYHTDIPVEECQRIAQLTKEYEESFLLHEISFLERMNEFFSKHKLRHVRKVYNDRLQSYNSGAEINVFVYYKGNLELNKLKKIL